MPALGIGLAVAAAGAFAGFALAAGLERAGPMGALAPLVLLIFIALLRFPEVCLALLLVGAGLAEAESVGAIPSGNIFYEQVLSSLTTPDVLLLLGLAGVLLRFASNDLRPRLPDPLTLPLLVLGMALVAGVATAYNTGSVSTGELFHRSTQVGYVILVPLLTVNVLRDRRALKIFAVAAAALACVKGVTGIYATTAGSRGVEDELASFLNPFPNLLILTYALGVVAALVRRVRIPTWMIAGAPVAMLALLLSYRRSFWIAAVFTLILVIIIASRRRGRAVVAIGAVALVLALVGAATIGSSSPTNSGSESPLAERAQTLTPGGLGSNRGDRYRNDERANVIENIEQHPVTGVGLGVSWEIHRPLAEAHDRRYAHVAFLWYWLAFGILGAIAYVLLLASGLWTAHRVWRRHPDPVIQVCAIAAFGGLVGLVVVELTATFTGVETRLSLLLGAILGWLAAAWHETRAPDLAAPTR